MADKVDGKESLQEQESWNENDSVESETDPFGKEGSPAEELAKLHEEIQLENAIYLPVNRFNGAVVVKYRAPGDDDMAAVMKHKAADGDIKKAFDANRQLLIRACEGIYLNKDEKYIPIKSNNQVVKFDSNLAEVIKSKSKSAKDVMVDLFGGKEDPGMAIHRQAADLIEWSENRSGKIAEDFSGN